MISDRAVGRITQSEITCSRSGHFRHLEAVGSFTSGDEASLWRTIPNPPLIRVASWLTDLASANASSRGFR